LPNRGPLAATPDADLAIYNENKDVTHMFSYPRYVIKGGETVVEEGEIRHAVDGRCYVFKPQFDESIEDYLRPVFQQFYTMSFDNYPVEQHRVHGMELIDRGVQGA
jgi:formylmethanofuran dehydrogenase subunit A